MCMCDVSCIILCVTELIILVLQICFASYSQKITKKFTCDIYLTMASSNRQRAFLVLETRGEGQKHKVGEKVVAVFATLFNFEIKNHSIHSFKRVYLVCFLKKIQF